jgi:hypothetical protein
MPRLGRYVIWEFLIQRRFRANETENWSLLKWRGEENGLEWITKEVTVYEVKVWSWRLRNWDKGRRLRKAIQILWESWPQQWRNQPNRHWTWANYLLEDIVSIWKYIKSPEFIRFGDNLLLWYWYGIIISKSTGFVLSY